MRGLLIIAFFFLTTCQETETPSTSFLVAHHAPLTTVVVSPPRHAVGVARNANITATFDTNVDAVTVDSDTFVVFAGGKRSGAYVSSTNTITFSPAQPFLAGEMVKTTLTASLEDTGGGPLTQPLVWEFHATSSTATATLTTPLLLGSATNWTRAIALGDLNGDERWRRQCRVLERRRRQLLHQQHRQQRYRDAVCRARRRRWRWRFGPVGRQRW